MNVVKFMFFFDHLSVLFTYNNVSVNRLYGFSEFLRPSLNALQFLPHLDSLQNDWMPYFPFNWMSLIILFVGRCLIYCTCFRGFLCQKLTVQSSAVQPGILISRLLLHMRGKYVASIILEPSASLHGRHVQKSSGVEIVACISLFFH